MSLYVADRGSGQILEFSLTEPVGLPGASASPVQSSVVKTGTSNITPPSPDPWTDLSAVDNTLIMSDCEVEEKVSGITHFAGANLWEMTLNGSVVRAANISPVAPTVVPMTDEPTGVTWDRSMGISIFRMIMPISLGLESGD